MSPLSDFEIQAIESIRRTAARHVSSERDLCLFRLAPDCIAGCYYYIHGAIDTTTFYFAVIAYDSSTYQPSIPLNDSELGTLLEQCDGVPLINSLLLGSASSYKPMAAELLTDCPPCLTNVWRAYFGHPDGKPFLDHIATTRIGRKAGVAAQAA